MSVLKNTALGKMVVLRATHTIGRSISSLLQIAENDISKNHATLSWEGDHWQLKDHSRNGSLLNGRLLHHASAKVTAETTLQFGSGKDTQWVMVNEKGPLSYLRAHTDKFKIIRLEEDHLVYPNVEDPLVSFFKTARLEWMMDDNESTRALMHNREYQFAGLTWTYYDNEPLQDTIDVSGAAETASIDCYLSSDEESVQIKIVVNDLEMNLGERVYNFLLLLLARKRLEDREAGFNESEQGWLFVEPLLAALSKELFREVDIYYFNVMIHRFRDHVRKLKPYGHLFANVIERKRGKIRLNYSSIRIIKES